MWKWVWLLCASAVFAQQEEIKNPRTSPADVKQGEKTFRSHCSPCHGFRGEGGRGPNLATGEFYHGSSDAALLQNISSGIPGTEMPGLFYSADRIWQIVAYLRSLNAGAAPAPAADVAQGQKLFTEKGCGGCHRVNGNGGRMGPDLSAAGKTRSRDYLRQSIVDPNADVRQRYWVVAATDGAGHAYEGFLLNQDSYTVQFIDFAGGLHSLERQGLKQFRIDKTSKMPSYANRLSGAEVDQLVAYLSSLRPAGGGE
jgi:putative heme-binding domain-containing protein